jgi:DNA-binding helix-hairpin-helix protein with protein kinase domain
MGFFDVKFTDLVAAHQRDKIREANEDALYELEKQTREINKARKQASDEQSLLRDQIYTAEQAAREQYEYEQSLMEDSLHMLNERKSVGLLPNGYDSSDTSNVTDISESNDDHKPNNHLENLKIRLAKGEITVDEYKKIKTVLES